MSESQLGNNTSHSRRAKCCNYLRCSHSRRWCIAGHGECMGGIWVIKWHRDDSECIVRCTTYVNGSILNNYNTWPFLSAGCMGDTVGTYRELLTGVHWGIGGC